MYTYCLQIIIATETYITLSFCIDKISLYGVDVSASSKFRFSVYNPIFWSSAKLQHFMYYKCIWFLPYSNNTISNISKFIVHNTENTSNRNIIQLGNNDGECFVW